MGNIRVCALSDYPDHFGGYGICYAEYCAPGAVDAITCKLPLEGKVLEIGSGLGGFLTKYGPAGMIGLDRYSKEFVADHPWVVNGEMHNLPFSDAEFDTLYSSNVFEHALSPTVALCEANRVLKTNGLFHLIVPKDIDTWVDDDSHISCLSDRLWRKLFRITGFRVIDFREHSNGPMMIYSLKKDRNWDAK